MTMQVRIALTLMVALGLMGLTSCDHYNCLSGATFGSSSCTASGSGLGGGGTGAATAFVFVTDTAGTIDGYTLNQEATTFAPTANYIKPTSLPTTPSLGMVVAIQKGAAAPFLYALYSTGIYGFSVGATGDLTPMTPVDLDSSSILQEQQYFQYSMIANPQGTLLFIAEPASGIVVYSIGLTGALALVQGSPFSTAGTGITPQNLGMDGLGNFLYVSEYSTIHKGGTTIGAYTVSNAGVLAPIGTGTFSAPLWQMQGDPSGKYLIGISGNSTTFSGAQDDQIYVYSIAQSGTANAGALTALPPLQTNPAYSPFSMAVQPVAGTSGPLVYSFSLNNLGLANAIEGYQLSPTTGGFSTLQGNPGFGAGVSTSGGFDPSGNYLFIYQEQSITAYQVSSTGALTGAFGFSTGINTGGYWVAVDVP
jgi:hypothetical protein